MRIIPISTIRSTKLAQSSYFTGKAWSIKRLPLHRDVIEYLKNKSNPGMRISRCFGLTHNYTNMTCTQLSRQFSKISCECFFHIHHCPTSPIPSFPPEQESILLRSSDSIDPRSKSIPPFRDLQLNVRCGTSEIASAKFLPRLVHFQYILAIDRVRILCPGQSASTCRFNVRT